MHYSFIFLLQLPYRPHFGEDKTCHLWVESGEMMGDFKEEEEEEDEVGRGGRGGWVERMPAVPPPFTSLSLSLPLFSSTLLFSSSLALAVSLCNENLSLIEERRRAAGGGG